MKMTSEQFADEMIKDFAPKIKPVTRSQVEEVEEKINKKMKEAAAEEPEVELVDDPEPEAPEYEEDEAETKEEE